MPIHKSTVYSLLSSAKKAVVGSRKSEVSSGFTLIELLVTITIIAILAAVGSVVYSSAQKTGRVSKRVQDLKAIKTGLELYKISTGTYATQSAVATCANAVTGLAPLAPTYMPAIPRDPLNNATNCYRYQTDTNGTEYKVWTVSSEMSANDYNTQPSMVDPNRDGTAGCTLEAIPAGTTTPTTFAWAVYSSKGTTAGTDACGY